jgi:D-alanyl-D-alanine carboxypeptidase
MTQSRPPALLAALVVLMIALGSALPAWAAKARAGGKPEYSAIVIDARTGAVLHAEAPDARRYPASLTKMMTVFMILEAIDQRRLRFDTEWRVSPFAAAQSPTKLGLQAGSTITVREVVLGLVTKSANDAAVVAAENMAGSESAFAERMTQRAHKLGMSRTTFMNASGLPNPKQVTTAYDMARLSRALIHVFPHHYHLFSTSQFTYAGITHHNHNRFMEWYDGADGLKTGYVHASGFNLAASAVRNDRRLIGVVMGGRSPGGRDERMGVIMDAAFSRQVTPALPETRQARAPARQAPAPAPVPATATPKPELSTVALRPAEPAADRRSPAPTATRSAAPAETAAKSEGPAPRATIRPGWAVQVGAYNDTDQARRAAEQARKLAPTALRTAAIDVQKVGGSGRDANLLRARLSGLSAGEAREACRILQRSRRACFTIAPSSSQAVAAVR